VPGALWFPLALLFSLPHYTTELLRLPSDVGGSLPSALEDEGTLGGAVTQLHVCPPLFEGACLSLLLDLPSIFK
jgi:hypothetical protein